MRIHLDTDLGGDTDDACALAMLLGRPGVELVGITTVADPSLAVRGGDGPGPRSPSPWNVGWVGRRGGRKA